MRNELLQIARRKGLEPVSLEQELESALDESGQRLEAWLSASDTSPSRQAMNKERFARLHAALEQLPETQRIAIEMHYLQGEGYPSICEKLGTMYSAVAGLLYRGLRALRETLEER